MRPQRRSSHPFSVFPGIAAMLIAALYSFGQDKAATPTGGYHYVFPKDAGIVNVKTDFGAKGDGATDDTQAIRAAIKRGIDKTSRYASPAFVYFPKGTYLVTDVLESKVDDGGWSGGWRAGMLLVGESRDGSVIRLKDNCPGYNNPKKPKYVIASGSESNKRGKGLAGGGNRAFRHSLINLTISTGRGNPGAVGFDYVANNRGTVEDVVIRSEDGQGFCGLRLERWWPGPALCKRVSIEGFDYGIRTGHYQYSMTFEYLTLRNQNKCGILSKQQVMSIRGLKSENSVPVIDTTPGDRGQFVLIDSEFIGVDAKGPAIKNKCKLVLRNVKSKGYPVVVDNQTGNKKKIMGGPEEVLIDEYLSHSAVSLFGPPKSTLNLPIKETPEYYTSDFSKWTSPLDHGGRTKGDFMEFTGIVKLKRTDAQLDFHWRGGSPAKAMPKDWFSTRWTGAITVPAKGKWTFNLQADDGGRVHVNEQKIIDIWSRKKRQPNGAIELEAGKRYPICVEYYEHGHDARLVLSWTGPDGKKQVVPKAHLYPAMDAEKADGLSGVYYVKGTPDNGDAIQKAIDSGKEIVYLPNGGYRTGKTIIIRGNVRKIIGFQSSLSGPKDKPLLRFEGGHPNGTIVEHMRLDGTIEHASKQTLTFRHCDMHHYHNTEAGTGDLFLEDTIGPKMKIKHPQKVWARQLNIEFGKEPLIENHGGTLWILGYKTEGDMICIKTVNGTTELLGAMFYPLRNVPRTNICMLNENARTSFTYAWNYRNYWIHVKETKDGETKILNAKQLKHKRGPVLYTSY